MEEERAIYDPGLKKLHKFLGGNQFCSIGTLLRHSTFLQSEGVIFKDLCGRGTSRRKKIFWYPSQVIAYRSIKTRKGLNFFEKK